MDLKTQKLLQKKTLTTAEVTALFAVLSQTPEGLQTALRHQNRAIRRLALHASHAKPAVVADASAAANEVSGVEPEPIVESVLEPTDLPIVIPPTIEIPRELFTMSVDPEVSWISETCGIHFPTPSETLAQKFPMFSSEVIDKTLNEKGSMEAAMRSLAAKRARLAQKRQEDKPITISEPAVETQNELG